MKPSTVLPAVLLLSCAAAIADDTLEIGAVVREFYVKDVTGPAAGTELCYRCRYGNRPVVSVFVRSVDEELATLIAELDEVVGSNADRKMAGFVVLMTDDPADHEAWPNGIDRDELVDRLWLFGLKHLPTAVKCFREAPSKLELRGRVIDTWRPILATALVLDPAGTGLFSRVKDIAAAYQVERAEFEASSR